MAKQSDTVYGFPCVENPNDFSPDYECCTEQEIANWKAACAAWDDGQRGNEVVTNKGCFSEYDKEGNLALHVTRTSWGIGVNSVEWDDESDQEQAS